MGLDMYLTGRKYFWNNWERPAANRHEDDKRIKNIDVELAYWRKHPNLHGYMVQAFAKGKDDCEEIELSADDLRNVLGAIKEKKLPQTSGFFFGESDGSERDEDIKIFTEALEWLEQSDPSPFDADERTDGPGFTMVAIKPREKTKADTKRQRVSRSVHYLGSW